jgi:hypothetical protein
MGVSELDTLSLRVNARARYPVPAPGAVGLLEGDCPVVGHGSGGIQRTEPLDWGPGDDVAEAKGGIGDSACTAVRGAPCGPRPKKTGSQWYRTGASAPSGLILVPHFPNLPL